MQLTEWVGKMGPARCVLLGQTELVTSFASLGILSGGKFIISAKDVNELAKGKVNNKRLDRLIEHMAGPDKRSENYYLAALYGGHLAVLHSLFDSKIPLPGYAFNVATKLNKLDVAKVMLSRDPSECAQGLSLSLERALIEESTGEMAQWLTSVSPASVRREMIVLATQYNRDYVLLPLLQGLAYNDLAEALVSAANRGDYSLSLFRTIFTHFGGLSYWNKETIWRALKFALLMVVPEEYTHHTAVADYILSLNLFSHQELLRLVNYHELIAETESRFCAMATWPLRVAYLRSVGVNVQSAVDETLAAHLADPVDSRNALNESFYKTILSFSPSKDNPQVLVALIDERQDYWVLQHFLDYGMKVSKDDLELARTKNRGAYNLLYRAFKKQAENSV
jgi:hypothetical protein